MDLGCHAKTQKVLNPESINSIEDGSEKVIWKFSNTCKGPSFPSHGWKNTDVKCGKTRMERWVM